MDKDKIIFYDFASDRTMCITFISEQLWLCYKHPDGQFVTDRKATIDDISKLCKLKRNNTEDVQELKAKIAAVREQAVFRISKPEADDQKLMIYIWF